MVENKQCPFCGEDVKSHASKCKHCLEFIVEQTQESNSTKDTDAFKAKLEFAGKFIIPVFVIVGLLIFRPTIKNLCRSADSAKFLGVSISFMKTNGFTGEITPLGLYYLIGAADGGGVRYEGKSVKPINEIRDKGLVTINIEKTTTGSPEMRGTWAAIKPTKAGVTFLTRIFHETA